MLLLQELVQFNNCYVDWSDTTPIHDCPVFRSGRKKVLPTGLLVRAVSMVVLNVFLNLPSLMDSFSILTGEHDRDLAVARTGCDLKRGEHLVRKTCMTNRGTCFVLGGLSLQDTKKGSSCILMGISRSNLVSRGVLRKKWNDRPRSV